MIKKIIPVLFFTIFITFSPVLTHAAGLPSQIVPCGTPDTHPCGVCDLATTFQNILAFLVYIFIIYMAARIVWTGSKLLFNNESSNKISEAKKSFSNILIAIIAVLGAWFIVNVLVSAALGKPGGAPWNRICLTEMLSSVA